MNISQEEICISPSFNSYSSEILVETAVRVAGERSSDAVGDVDNGSDDDFEFALLREDKEVSAYDGHIGLGFPVFKRDLLQKDGDELCTSSEDKLFESNVMISLSQLFIEEDNERDHPPSCSSSEADELECIPAGTYCVWRPRMGEPPLPSQCRKSKSTGSGSKRWKLRDLLRRSKSDGKESFVFPTPKHREGKPSKFIQTSRKANGDGSGSAAAVPASAHEAFYIRNRAMKEGDKKKSYLPYRQDLVGLFANINGMRRISRTSRNPHQSIVPSVR